MIYCAGVVGVGEVRGVVGDVSWLLSIRATLLAERVCVELWV